MHKDYATGRGKGIRGILELQTGNFCQNGYIKSSYISCKPVSEAFPGCNSEESPPLGMGSRQLFGPFPQGRIEEVDQAMGKPRPCRGHAVS